MSRVRTLRKINDPVASAWAGALAAFVLGKILEIALLLLRFFLGARSRSHPADAPGLVSFILRRVLRASAALLQERSGLHVTFQGGYYCLATTAANSSRKTGFRPRAGSSGTASTILAGPAGALGFTGELAADLFDP